MAEQKPKKMPEETPAKAIMVKPLPQILDELDNSISAAENAATDARAAAEEARQAGEKAASEAARVAAQAIARVEKVANDGLALAQLLNLAIRDAMVAIDKRLAQK